jgi:hypothetical protein
VTKLLRSIGDAKAEPFRSALAQATRPHSGTSAAPFVRLMMRGAEDLNEVAPNVLCAFVEGNPGMPSTKRLLPHRDGALTVLRQRGNGHRRLEPLFSNLEHSRSALAAAGLRWAQAHDGRSHKTATALQLQDCAPWLMHQQWHALPNPQLLAPFRIVRRALRPPGSEASSAS